MQHPNTRNNTLILPSRSTRTRVAATLVNQTTGNATVVDTKVVLPNNIVSEISQQIGYVKIIKKSLAQFVKSHGIENIRFINLVDYTNNRQGNAHAMNELNAARNGSARSYNVIECREDQLNFVEQHQYVRFIVVHRTRSDRPIRLDNRNAHYYIVVGSTGIPTVANLDKTGVAYIRGSGNQSNNRTFKIYHSMNRQPEFMQVYDELKNRNLYINRDLEIQQSSFTGRDFGIVQTNTSDILAGREYDRNSVTSIRIMENTCRIDFTKGLFIVHGKSYKNVSKPLVSSDLHRREKLDVSEFAVFFEDMTNAEIKSVEDSDYYYGYDTTPTTPHSKLNEYIRSSSVFSPIDGQLSQICALFNCDKDDFVAFADNCLKHYFSTEPKEANGLFNTMVLQAGFSIPIPMTQTGALQYEHIVKRRMNIRENSYVKEPYINERSAINLEMDIRYNRYMSRNVHSQRDTWIRNLKNGVDDAASIQYGQQLSAVYNENFLDLFDVEEGNVTKERVQLNVTNSVYISNVIELVIDSNSGNEHNVYIEDCVYVVIKRTRSPIKIFIQGNVHTIYNLSHSATIVFNNYSKPKNTTAVLISDRGSVNDHYSSYPDKNCNAILDEFEDMEDDNIENYPVPRDLENYKAAVKNYFYSRDNHHESIRIAEIDKKEILVI